MGTWTVSHCRNARFGKSREVASLMRSLESVWRMVWRVLSIVLEMVKDDFAMGRQ